MNYNKAIIAGRLTRDPNMKYTPGGTAVCEFGIASSRKRKGEEETLFIDVVLFGQQAETAGQHISKGQVVLVEGRLKQDQWEDKNSGQRRSKITIVGDSVQFGPRPQEGGGQRQQQFRQHDPDSNSQWEDDIPF